MIDTYTRSRRTVLKSVGAGIAGGLAAAGTTSVGANPRGLGRGPQHQLEIVAEHDDDHEGESIWSFDLSTREIPGGWTTMTFDNLTSHTHFSYLVWVTPEALDDWDGEAPALMDFEGDTVAEKYVNAVNQPFQDAWDPYYAGDIDVGEFFANLIAAVPDWFLAGGVVPIGGPGLTSGEITSKTTSHLHPGVYVMECYVLDEEGRFHSPFGMVESFEVTGDGGPTKEPTSMLDVTISSEEGLSFGPDVVHPGRYTVGVTFEDNIAYGHALGHDVHLIRLDAGASPQDVSEWINYLNVGPDGFYNAENDALVSTHDNPGPETFLGGVQDLFAMEYPAMSYLDVILRPGEYAWVAEVPDPLGTGMLETFTVKPRRDIGRGAVTGRRSPRGSTTRRSRGRRTNR